MKDSSQNNDVEQKVYEIGPIIGKGAFSSVYKGKLISKKNNAIVKEEIIALKLIPIDIDEETKRSIDNEIMISLHLININIVKMIEVIKLNGKRYIAYEFCNGGDLRKYMDYFGKFDESLIQIIMLQLVNGLSELFQKDVVHHDIKPENILIKLCYKLENPENNSNIQIIHQLLKNKENKKNSSLINNDVNNQNLIVNNNQNQNYGNFNNNVANNMYNNNLNNINNMMNMNTNNMYNNINNNPMNMNNNTMPMNNNMIGNNNLMMDMNNYTLNNMNAMNNNMNPNMMQNMYNNTNQYQLQNNLDNNNNFNPNYNNNFVNQNNGYLNNNTNMNTNVPNNNIMNTNMPNNNIMNTNMPNNNIMNTNIPNDNMMNTNIPNNNIMNNNMPNNNIMNINIPNNNIMNNNTTNNNINNNIYIIVNNEIYNNINNNLNNNNINNNFNNNNMFNNNINNNMNVNMPNNNINNNLNNITNNNMFNNNINNNMNDNNDKNIINNNIINNNNLNNIQAPIINTNLKPKNINNNRKFKESDFLKILKESTEYKLSDFGLSKLKSEIYKRNLCGSPLYMSPELFKIDSKLSDIENKKVDIWALGILAYELFFGKRPFEAFSIEELSSMHERGFYYIDLESTKDKKISKEFFKFLNRCLQKDPKKRANVLELKKSDFLNMDVDSSDKMDQTQFEKYLGIKRKNNSSLFKISINLDYDEEFAKRKNMSNCDNQNNINNN